MSSGLGSQNLARYYYNPITRQCSQFNYRGTMGNDNNFLTESSCASQCPGKKTASDLIMHFMFTGHYLMLYGSVPEMDSHFSHSVVVTVLQVVLFMGQSAFVV